LRSRVDKAVVLVVCGAALFLDSRMGRRHAGGRVASEHVASWV
jgi:hypothetical protein